MTVFEFPPSESCSSLVRRLFLYGMNLVFPSTRADITIPRFTNDRFIIPASSFRFPVAPVLEILSEPYREICFKVVCVTFIVHTVGIVLPLNPPCVTCPS